jgi:hypothetical protein
MVDPRTEGNMRATPFYLTLMLLSIFGVLNGTAFATEGCAIEKVLAERYPADPEATTLFRDCERQAAIPLFATSSAVVEHGLRGDIREYIVKNCKETSRRSPLVGTPKPGQGNTYERPDFVAYLQSIKKANNINDVEWLGAMTATTDASDAVEVIINRDKMTSDFLEDGPFTMEIKGLGKNINQYWVDGATAKRAVEMVK